MMEEERRKSEANCSVERVDNCISYCNHTLFIF